MQKENHLITIKSALIVILFIGIFSYFLSINRSFPFYFLFDMDQIVTLDTALILSGKFPEHIYHTTFGVYLITSLFARSAFVFGALPFLDFKTLIEAINPYFVIAQFTDFFRLVPPFICTIIVLIWGLIFNRLANLSFPKTIFTIVCIASSPGLIWQSALIKSEQISILFWLIGLYLAIFFLCKNKKTNHLARFQYSNFGILLLSGIFIGLAFITKIQSIFFIFLYYIALTNFVTLDNIIISKNLKKISISLVFLTLLLFTLFYWKSIDLFVTSSATGASNYRINFFSNLFLSLIGINLALLLTIKKLPKSIASLSSAISVCNFGFLLAFMFHFLIYKNPSTSYTYLLYDFKMVFLRELVGHVLPKNDFLFYLNHLIDNIKLLPTLFAVAMIAIISNFLLILISNKSKWLLLIFFSAILVSFFNILLAVRNWGSDVIWLESSLYFLIAISLFNIAQYTSRIGKDIWFSTLFYPISLLIIFSNIQVRPIMLENLNANISLYGWNKSMSLGPVYGGNHPILTNSYDKNFTSENKRAALDSSSKYKEYLEIAEFPFQNQNIMINHIGILNPGYRIWNNDSVSRIAQPVPEFLQNSVLVNLEHLSERKEYLWSKSNNFNLESYRQNITIKKTDTDTIPILYRPELNIYLFTEIPYPTSSSIEPCIDNLKIIHDDKYLNFLCYKIKASIILYKNKISEKYFFGINKN